MLYWFVDISLQPQYTAIGKFYHQYVQMNIWNENEWKWNENEHLTQRITATVRYFPFFHFRFAFHSEEHWSTSFTRMCLHSLRFEIRIVSTDVWNNSRYLQIQITVLEMRTWIMDAIKSWILWVHSKKLDISKYACTHPLPNGIFTIFDVHFEFAFAVAIETMRCFQRD